VEGGNGEERGGPGRSVGQRGGPTATHAGGEAWHVARLAGQGRGGGADRWATTTVPGGGTG
jgi:hypothetical protein